MLQKIKVPFLLALAVCLSGTAKGQDIESVTTPRFKPFAGVTYNIHFIGQPEFQDPTRNAISQFPGVEFGFSLLPKTPAGWTLEYRNTFLGELLLYQIFDISPATWNGVFADVVDRTVNNGFLGRLDIGKQLTGSEFRSFNAGFVISDKVMLGTDLEVPFYIYGPEETVTNTGFHFTPGFFASYEQLLSRAGALSVRLAFTQSLFNLHQFGESAIEHYTLPLFSELDIKLRTNSGFYYLAGALLATSYKELPADARIRAGIGYTFRK
jgi:hypothetical protein